MIKYEKVLCDIMECTAHSQKGIISSGLLSGFDGCIYYDGKPIEKNIPFIHITERFTELYIPENKFNFITKFLIGFHSRFNRGITIDNKKFFTSYPDKIGDIFVKNSENAH